MVSLATETDRTLFFDFLPLDLGKIKGFSTKFQLYTVPGQVYYNATRNSCCEALTEWYLSPIPLKIRCRKIWKVSRTCTTTSPSMALSKAVSR